MLTTALLPLRSTRRRLSANNSCHCGRRGGGTCQPRASARFSLAVALLSSPRAGGEADTQTDEDGHCPKHTAKRWGRGVDAAPCAKGEADKVSRPSGSWEAPGYMSDSTVATAIQSRNVRGALLHLHLIFLMVHFSVCFLRVN